MRTRALFKFLSQTQMRKSRPEMIFDLAQIRSVETCRDVGDVAEDSVERKEAVDRTEAGEVVKTEVLLIIIL